jgi:hypothetical protein
MKTTTKLLLITLFVTLLQSCTKDPEPFNNVPLNTYYYLTAWQLNQTPYFTNKAFDTISFASDKGDTLTFVKTKTDTTWYCERNSNNPSNLNQDCYQTIHNIYNTIKGVGSFDVKHSRKISYKDFTNIIQINFNSFYFSFFESVINDNTYKQFIGTIQINNKIYNNTFYEYHNLYNSDVAKAIFCPKIGIVNIIDSLNTSNWNLNK